MKKYGLIGFPLEHSFSEKYFTEKFSREKIVESIYMLFPILSIEKLTDLIKSQPDLVGFNVTIPYKIQVISFLDEIDKEAAEIGSVNTVKIIRKTGKIILKGYNTDVYGIDKVIISKLEPWHHKALILGSGGASKTVQYFCAKKKIQFIVVSRNPSEGMIGYPDIDRKVIEEHTLIFNTTPVGMFPHINDKPEIPYEFLSKKHLLFDLIYNPEKTLFLQEGKARGTKTMNGLEMLKVQADKSWQIWNNP